MDLAIKPKIADQIRAKAERYPDHSPEALARMGGWPLAQVRSALAPRKRDMPKSRAG